jgi:hypothetical protein
MMGVFENINEPIGAIKSRCFLYFQRDHKFFRKAPAV